MVYLCSSSDAELANHLAILHEWGYKYNNIFPRFLTNRKASKCIAVRIKWS